ncbi:hypothetical protein MJO28_012125 [Puccinia striiformis f. sp. tritici]|uniref:Uncharacterized protein n=1 Tax=Puccinia striiformis f. sp. tritici TaxID=168172 RepID=A0ACC0DZ37_9BASI|nr:hypothetical protein MJO28_012125 [Puccinia striiformis f. sp. tritici]
MLNIEIEIRLGVVVPFYLVQAKPVRVLTAELVVCKITGKKAVDTGSSKADPEEWRAAQTYIPKRQSNLTWRSVPWQQCSVSFEDQ